MLKLRRTDSGRGRSWNVVLLALAVSACGGAAFAEMPPSARQFVVATCRADAGAAASARPASLKASAAASRPAGRPVAQVTRNEKADVTFELRPSANGGIEVAGRSGTLQVTKTVQSSGEFVLELTTDRDKVTISTTGQGTTVVRGKSSATVRRSDTSSENGDKARRLLADSKAVPQFRAISAALIDADDRSPASLAFIMADAAVGMLTGDVGAARRTAQFLARRSTANLRPAGLALDCYTVMEQRMTEAWGDFYSCVYSVYGSWFYEDLCGYRWLLQVESYWFGFLSCTGFNW